jgi:hypothetical protein
MSEKRTPAGAEEDKTVLDLVEEALVGSHQEVPPDLDEETPDGPRPVLKSP